MNMKMEEQQENNLNKADAKRKSKRQPKRQTHTEGDFQADESESVVSGDEAPSEYEQMLQKYEAEVRNHIKIEQ